MREARVPGLPAIDRLRQLVDRRWRSAGYEPAAFTKIASDALQALSVHDRLTPKELLETVIATGGTVQGHPASEVVPLYAGPQFSIFAHFWIDALAIPHSHDWNGAFQVLEGTSIYSTYRFSDAQRVDAGFQLGTLRTMDTSILVRGDVRPVHAGLDGVHSIFHVDRPSVSLSLRCNVRGTMAMDLWMPGIAVQTLPSQGSIEATLKCLRTMAAVYRTEHDRVLERAIREGDLRTIYLLLDHGRHYHSDRERLRRTVMQQRARLGPGIPLILAAAEERARIRWYMDLRTRIGAPQHRFFLGLMCFCEDRESAFDLIVERFPGADPIDQVTRWVGELAGSSQRRPPPIGFSLTKNAIAILGQLLRNRDASTRSRRDAAMWRACTKQFAQLRLLTPLFRRRGRARAVPRSSVEPR